MVRTSFEHSSKMNLSWLYYFTAYYGICSLTYIDTRKNMSWTGNRIVNDGKKIWPKFLDALELNFTSKGKNTRHKLFHREGSPKKYLLLSSQPIPVSEVCRRPFNLAKQHQIFFNCESLEWYTVHAYCFP